MRSCLTSVAIAFGALACSATPHTSAPARTCPADLAMPEHEHCNLSTVCPIGDGMCLCKGDEGGTPPEVEVDDSHWECGKIRHRSDGCPDDVATGGACSDEQPAVCSEVQGLCYHPHKCEAGHWAAIEPALCPKAG